MCCRAASWRRPPGTGHAPTVVEPVVLAALDRFPRLAHPIGSHRGLLKRSEVFSIVYL